MGNTYAQEVQYARFVPGTETEGYSAELVSIVNKDQNDFKSIPEPGVDTVWKAFKATRARIPDANFLGSRDPTQEGSPYKWKTWREVEEMVDDLAAGYQHFDLMPEVQGEGKQWRFMGVYAKNREEWTMSDMASLRQSGTTIAFYDTLGAAAVEYVIKQTELTTISCAGNYLRTLVMLKSQGRADSLQNLVSFDVFDDDVKSDAEEAGLKIYHISDVIKAGQENREAAKFEEPTADSVYMFCYTSGTTGDPKAAKLTHRNIMAAATASKYGGFHADENDCMISYLPLAHSFEKCLFVMSLIRGIRIGYFGGDVLKLTEDCEILQPTMFPSVPRLFCRIYDKITGRLKELTGAKSYLANRAISSKLYYLENGAHYTYGFYDMAVCNKFRQVLGGQVRLMVTGSAPIAVDVLNFLKVCFCCPILEGYGQTESSAASCITLPQDSKAGHVGGPLPCLKIKLRDIPDMEYTSADQPYPRGEICFAGPSVFEGYYKNDEKTAEALKDGWLYSGDVGMIMPNGSVKIIDRAKNIFKLAQGEYIAPEKLENVYIQSPYLQQVFVHGESLENFLVGVVVPDFDAIKKWNSKLEEKLLSDSPTAEEICASPDVMKLIMGSMNELAAANKLNGLEKVRKLHMHPSVFTIEEDLLTPSMKLKRGVAAKVFKEQIQTMYGKA